MVLIIDNYDSFTYNLVQFVGTITPDIRVIRNDELSVDEIKAISPSHIILSPGPGYPAAAGVCEEVVMGLAGKIPILGVCLGHQAICEAYGAKICHAKKLMHGKKSNVSVDVSELIFKGLPEHLEVARYHSLVADPDTMPDTLKCISTDDGNHEIMAVKHTDYEVYGLQFHPESILTPDGMQMLKNFISI